MHIHCHNRWHLELLLVNARSFHDKWGIVVASKRWHRGCKPNSTRGVDSRRNQRIHPNSIRRRPAFNWDHKLRPCGCNTNEHNRHRAGDSIGAFTVDLPGGIVGNNLLINPGFQIYQRGGTTYASASNTVVTYAASSTVITMDRWELLCGANQTIAITQQAPGKGRSGIYVQRSSGQTGTGTIRLCQSLPPEYCSKLFSQTCTLSFSAACGATYSPTSSLMVVNRYTGTGTGFTSGTEDRPPPSSGSVTARSPPRPSPRRAGPPCGPGRRGRRRAIRLPGPAFQCRSGE